MQCCPIAVYPSDDRTCDTAVSAEHKDIAVRKVDEAQYVVHHRITVFIERNVSGNAPDFKRTAGRIRSPHRFEYAEFDRIAFGFCTGSLIYYAIAPEEATCSLDKKQHIRYDNTVLVHGIIP